MKKIVFIGIGLLFLSACGQIGSQSNEKSSTEDDQQENPKTLKYQKIVSLGGTVTEIIFALGAGDRIVATDKSSIFPKEAGKLPQVGYFQRLNSEGVLSQNPDAIFAAQETGPPEVVKQIKQSKIPYFTFEMEYTVESSKKNIMTIAEKLGLREKGEKLIIDLEKDLEEVKTFVNQSRLKNPPKILFIYARGQGTLSVAGQKSALDNMIKLAGGENAVQEFEGFKALTAEAVVKANPDWILMTSRGLKSIGGEEGLKNIAGVSQTQAGKNKKIIHVEDLALMGFGPRMGKAVLELARKLHSKEL